MILQFIVCTAWLLEVQWEWKLDFFYRAGCPGSRYSQLESKSSLLKLTGSLYSSSCVVKTSFGHIPSIEQSKRDGLITVIKSIFNIFYGTSEKCKALYRTGSFTQSLI